MAYIEWYLVILNGIQKIHNNETHKSYSWGGKIWLTHYKERKQICMPLCTNPSSCSIIYMYKVCMYYTEIKLLIWYSCVRASLVWFYNYNQQDATIFEYLFLKNSTCFGWFPRPSSGAHNCTFSFRYYQPILLQAGVVDKTTPACSSIGWQYLKLNVQLCAPDDGRRNRTKHVKPFRNK